MSSASGGWGGAASVAALLRGLESRVALHGVVGDDPAGQTLRRLLVDDGIEQEGLLTDADRVTTTKERFLGRSASRSGGGGQQILRVDQEQCSPVSEEIERRLSESLANCLDGRSAAHDTFGTAEQISGRPTFSGRPSPSSSCAPPPDFTAADLRRSAYGDQTMSSARCSALLISDYNKGVCTPGLLQKLIETARARQLPVIVDPARIADYSRYQNATLLIPNRAEAEAATGITIDGPASAQRAAEKLCRDCCAEAVIVKLDSEGMVLFEAGGECRHFATQAREVYDVTGAGDMVLAIVGMCLADGASLADAVELANVAAGLQVERLGVQPISRQELRRAIPARQANNSEIRIPNSEIAPKNPGAYTPGSPSSILHPRSSSVTELITLSELVSLADVYRRAGKRLVFTNGCFDLLHVGHISYLEEAKGLGDVLIVAVNSDAGVRQLKGPDRPVIDQQSRAAMLAALACVDHVVIFDEPTPHELLRAIRPQVLVKGGTYRSDQVVGREIVEAYGGLVGVLGEVAGISTTRILASVKDTVQVQ